MSLALVWLCLPVAIAMAVAVAVAVAVADLRLCCLEVQRPTLGQSGKSDGHALISWTFVSGSVSRMVSYSMEQFLLTCWTLFSMSRRVQFLLGIVSANLQTAGLTVSRETSEFEFEFEFAFAFAFAFAFSV